MYVSMQVIGNALSGGKGWNEQKGQAAKFTLSGMNSLYFYDWKPDMSICASSNGLLLSTLINEVYREGINSKGALSLWFDAEARLQKAELQWEDNAGSTSISGTTGLVTGSSPQAIGSEIQRLTPSKTYFNIGAAANYSVVALASGVYKWCKITSINSGKVLDIRDASTADGAELQQWGYGGGANQHWRLVPVSPNSYIIVSVHSSKTLDVPGHSTSNGAQIVQWEYHGGANQHWRVVELGNDNYKIESVESSKALVVLNAATTDGAPVVQYNYSGTPNERWRIDGL
jgi:hypothetical protein